MIEHHTRQFDSGVRVAGQKIRELITVNGIRVVLEDGTWD